MPLTGRAFPTSRWTFPTQGDNAVRTIFFGFSSGILIGVVEDLVVGVWCVWSIAADFRATVEQLRAIRPRDAPAIAIHPRDETKLDARRVVLMLPDARGPLGSSQREAIARRLWPGGARLLIPDKGYHQLDSIAPCAALSATVIVLRSSERCRPLATGMRPGEVCEMHATRGCASMAERLARGGHLCVGLGSHGLCKPKMRTFARREGGFAMRP